LLRVLSNFATTNTLDPKFLYELAVTSSAAPLDPADLADAFFGVAHALKRTVNARFQHTALSVARLRVLFSLATLGPQRMGELSTCVDVAARTMTSTVEAMERDGLVRRRPDPADGRATVVHLTDAGVRAYDEGRRVQAAAVADVFAGLPLDQREELAALLDSLAQGIPGHEGDASAATARTA
jgi:DNA-binding MarR family transcriptional regulator